MRSALATVFAWLSLGLLFGLLLWPDQALSELGFRLQRLLWLEPQAHRAAGAVLVFGATAASTARPPCFSTRRPTRVTSGELELATA